MHATSLQNKEMSGLKMKLHVKLGLCMLSSQELTFFKKNELDRQSFNEEEDVLQTELGIKEIRYKSGA